MDVLFTGNMTPFSQGFFDKIGEEYRCIVYSEKEIANLDRKNITIFDKKGENQMEQVFATFNFDTVIYFSHALDGVVRVFDELEYLENTLFLCQRSKVRHFVYVMSNDLYKEDQEEENTSRGILIRACENLCQSFSEKGTTTFMVVRVPHLYSMKPADNQLNLWLREAVENRPLENPGDVGQETDFLCDEDLGELLSRVLDEPAHESYTVANISGENVMSYLELENMLKKRIPTLKVEHGHHILGIPGVLKNNVARLDYGWYPRHDLRDDLDVLLEGLRDVRTKKYMLYERRKRFQSFSGKLRAAGEVVVAFAVAQLLQYWVRDNVLLNFLDFRLIYVIVMGMMNGLNAGVAAAALASLGYIWQSASKTPWQVLFYNVQNWLPFACYFLLGSACGYNRDKHDDEVLYAREEHGILEQKYIFLHDLYIKVLDSKDTFNSQIIGYKDSFGKLYAIVKRLNSVLPERVFYEAVSVLEEALGNYSVAIYAINGQSDFARLNVCSKNLNSVLGKSLKLSRYPQMTAVLRENQVFVNTDCLEDYPAYATPIFRGGELLGMILLKYAADNQMSREFSNKFSIVTDLIRDSLIRAMEFYDISNHYLEGTQILEAGEFAQILDVKSQMQEKQYMEYVLLRIEQGGRSLVELSNIISSMVRANDVLGMSRENELCLLLSQTKYDDMGVISERMQKNGIQFEIVSG